MLRIIASTAEGAEATSTNFEIRISWSSFKATIAPYSNYIKAIGGFASKSLVGIGISLRSMMGGCYNHPFAPRDWLRK